MDKPIRYNFEHKAFKDMFLNDPKEVFSAFKNKGTKAFFEYEAALLDDGQIIEEYQDNVNVTVVDKKFISIKLAPPEHRLECTDIVLYYDEKRDKSRYFTVECDICDDELMFFPCEWVGEQHSIIGDIHSNVIEALKEIIFSILREEMIDKNKSKKKKKKKKDKDKKGSKKK